jgi:hypothetical protein
MPSYPNGRAWRDYPVTLTYPNGRTAPATVRAVSHRDADWRASRRWPIGGPITFAIGDPA